eukprot:1265490-Pyramimonas_sp.AAC.1
MSTLGICASACAIADLILSADSENCALGCSVTAVPLLIPTSISVACWRSEGKAATLRARAP